MFEISKSRYSSNHRNIYLCLFLTGRDGMGWRIGRLWFCGFVGVWNTSYKKSIARSLMSGRLLFLCCLDITNFLLFHLISPGLRFRGEGSCLTHVVWSISRTSTSCTSSENTNVSRWWLWVSHSDRIALYNSRHQQHKVSIYFSERKCLFSPLFVRQEEQTLVFLPCFQWDCLWICWLTCSCNMLINIYNFPTGTEVGGPFTLVPAKYQMAKNACFVAPWAVFKLAVQRARFCNCSRGPMSADLSCALPLPISMI